MNGPSINNIDQWLFEAAEGNLSASQEAQLDSFLLENPAFLEEQSIWSEAKVTAEPVVYPHTSSLIKKPLWVRPVVYIPAAAILVLGLFLGYDYFMTDEGSTMAVSSDVSTQSKAFLNANDSSGPDGDHSTSMPSVSRGEELTTLDLTDEAEVLEKSSPTQLSNVDDYNANTTSSTVKTSSLDEERLSDVNTNIDAEELVPDVSDFITDTENGGKPATKTDVAGAHETTVEKGVQEKSNQSAKVQEEPTYSAMIEKDEVKSDGVEPANITDLPESESSIAGSDEPLNENQTESILEADENRFKNLIVETLNRNPLEEVLNETQIAYATIEGTVLKPKYDQTRIASNYDASFKSVMRSSMRKLVRMMDNPLALKNAKDMVYHVPNMQTLDVNFSSVGSMMVPRLQLVSRAQYLGRSNEQFMNQLAFDTYVRSLRGGVGIQLMNNYYGQGAYNTSQIALAYSPKIGVSKNVVLEPGMRLKFGNTLVNDKKLNPSQLVEVNRMNVEPFFDENTQSIGSNLWYQDIGLSLQTNTKWFTAGVQIDNIGRHYENVYNNLNPLGRRAPLHFTAMLGTDYMSRNKNISISPYTFYQKMEKLSEIWAGSIFRLKRFTIGGAYSSLGDFAGSIGFKTNLVMLTYSADYTSSAIFNTRLLSHQLSLRILFNSGPYSQRMLKLK